VNRALAAIVALLVLLLGAAVWIGASSPEERDAGAGTTAPGPPRAVRKRARAPADATGPAATEEEPEAAPPADAALLAVRVLSGEGGAPVKGASVTVTDADCEAWSAATDADGAALFAGLPPGATELRAEAKGFLAATKTIVLAAKQEAHAELKLERASVLEGVLVDAASGVPIADAEIEVVATDDDGQERLVGDGQTDATGRYHAESLPGAGRVVLRVREPGRRPREIAIALGTETGARVEVPREIAGRLSGTVRTPEGLPAATASVVLRRVAATPRDPPERVADCRKDGSYVFDDVPLGVELVAVASAEGSAAAVPTEPLTFDTAAAERRHDFTLRRPATLTVNVPNPSRPGGPQSLLVMVRFDDESAASALSSGSGTVLRSDLTPGTHRVRVTCNGFLPVERRVELPEGGKTEIEILLSPGLEIGGSVVDAAGKGVANAAVSAVDPELPDEAGRVRSDLSQRAFADYAGEFRFTGLQPGRYRLVAYFGTGPRSAPQVVSAPASGLRFVLAPGTKISLGLVLPAGVAAPASITASASAETFSPNLESADCVELRPEPLAWTAHRMLETEVAADMTWLRVLVPGCAPAVVALHTDAGNTADLGEVRLEPAVAVKGRVVDAKGEGASGVTVWATLTGAPVRTGADGSFEAGGLATGTAIVRAACVGWFGAATADAGGAPATIVLRRMGTIVGVVTDGDGVPVRDAVVAVRHGFSASPLDRGCSERVTSDGAGRFRFGAASGRVRVCAGGEWVEVTVPEDGEVAVTVRRP
jgi:protocatechuate 3,4-dioxygenase beta subunit